MKYVIWNNSFDDEACDRLLRRELHSKVAENIRLKQELDNFKKKHDIPSAYPGSTRPTFVINKVLFNPPATIVFWLDGTKTVVKCKEGEEFSEWAGIALCLAKKLYGPNFHKIFRAHCSDPEKTVNDILTKDNWKKDDVRKACMTIRQYQHKLGYSGAWMSEYVYNVVILAKKEPKPHDTEEKK